MLDGSISNYIMPINAVCMAIYYFLKYRLGLCSLLDSKKKKDVLKSTHNTYLKPRIFCCSHRTPGKGADAVISFQQVLCGHPYVLQRINFHRKIEYCKYLPLIQATYMRDLGKLNDTFHNKFSTVQNYIHFYSRCTLTSNSQLFLSIFLSP